MVRPTRSFTIVKELLIYDWVNQLFSVLVIFRKNYQPLRTHMSLREQHQTKTHRKEHQICTLHNSDISDYKCKVDAFEVSSKGFLTTRNHTTLATLHKFINPAIKLQHFKKNISALSLAASYHIFNCKSEPTFVEPPFLLPPIKS